MSEEQDGFMLNAFGVDLGQLAQNVKDEGAALLSQAGGQAASDFRIPEAPPPEPDPSPQLRIPEALPPEPSQPTQLPAQPSNDDGGGGATGNSGGAPFSKSGTAPAPQSDSTPESPPPIDLEGSVSLEQVKTVLGGLVDGALEIVKEIAPPSISPGPVIIAPIEKLLREARGEPDPDDGA